MADETEEILPEDAPTSPAFQEVIAVTAKYLSRLGMRLLGVDVQVGTEAQHIDVGWTPAREEAPRVDVLPG